jgi:hypothetical protein
MRRQKNNTEMYVKEIGHKEVNRLRVTEKCSDVLT